MSTPLRFKISNWHQLCKVISNNSRELSITVTDLVSSNILTGLLIQVIHTNYGCLFACVVNAQGTLVTVIDGHVPELSVDQILTELSKYGFYVTYNPRAHLPGDQLEFLMSLRAFGYEKLRILNVWHLENGVKKFNWYIVAFNISANPEWINNGYSPKDAEFVEALRNGSASNISALGDAQKWSWSWLDYIANIDDIIADNA